VTAPIRPARTPARRLADVIVIDGDPLTDMSTMRNVVHVVKDGKVYK
jgi:imidazolonepropionase-like amidohydrolase